MATPKTWTAEDLRQGKLTITRIDTILHVERRYNFEDIGGDVIADIAAGRVVEDIEWSDIPPAVQGALTVIDAWTYNKALDKEGMT